MRRNVILPGGVTILLLILFAQQLQAQQPAFPGAEGFGMYTSGGRGGRVIKVTNLNDSGEGSLRAAVQASGPRIVVFEVSGIIELQSSLYITSPYITIAGQTAPGDGICIKNRAIQIYGTHDIVIRYLRIRPGGNGDALEVTYSQNIMIDHCSMGWSTDEIVNIRKENENVTMQWCVLSESLNSDGHGYAASLGSRRASFHHNLLAHNYGRNPSIGGSEHGLTSPINFTNNVVYNYTNRAIDGKPHGINVINNYYKPGPSTGSHVNPDFVAVHDMKADGIEAENNWYIEGNYNPEYPEVIENNWAYVKYQGVTNEGNSRALHPFDDAGYNLRTAVEAYEEVLAHVGATVPELDSIDRRAIHDTRTGTATVSDGIIDEVSELGGWPEYKTYHVPIDTDGDGMPDDWELSRGLDPNDPADANRDLDFDGYPNIEDYLNSLVPAFFDTHPRVNILHPSMNELFIARGDTSIYVEAYARDYQGGNISEMSLYLNEILIAQESGSTHLKDTIKNIPAGKHHIIVEARDNTGNTTLDTLTVFVGTTRVHIDVEESPHGRIQLLPAGGVYSENVRVDLTAIPHEGYRFHAWTKSIESSRRTLSLTTARDLKLKPVFVPDSDVNGRYERRIRINFQPEEYLVSGYQKDMGLAYGERSGNYTYGWIEGNNYNRGTCPPKGVWRHFAQFESHGEVFSWGIALPKGIYSIRLGLGGQAGFYPNLSETELKIDVEGTLIEDPDGIDLMDEHFLEGVHVTDGQLTLSSVEESRICFIEIKLKEFLPDQELVVNQGSGDGSYFKDDLVLVSADVPSEGMVFDRWTGDTTYVEDLHASTTFISMPDRHVELSASYKAAELQEGYYLSVAGGSGTGYYPAGTKVEVSALDTISGGRFSHWEFDCLRALTIDEEKPGLSITTVAAHMVLEAVYDMGEAETGQGIYQAEDAEMDGASVAERYHGGYHGLGYVNPGLNRGSYVQFNDVDGQGGGYFLIKLRYSLNDEAREGVVMVNGVRDTVRMIQTGSWSDWSEVEVRGMIEQGSNNVIRVETTGDDLGYIDQIELVKLNTTRVVRQPAGAGLNASVYPNPISDQAHISFELTENGRVDIQLFDLQGKSVKELVELNYPAGKHTVQISREDLKPGLYILRIISGHTRSQFKVLVN